MHREINEERLRRREHNKIFEENELVKQVLMFYQLKPGAG